MALPATATPSRRSQSLKKCALPESLKEASGVELGRVELAVFGRDFDSKPALAILPLLHFANADADNVESEVKARARVRQSTGCC